MARKKGVSVTIRPTVCVEIVGRKRKRPKGARGPVAPMIREDDGLVSEFLDWLVEEKIFGMLRGGFNGAGSYLGFFDPKDLDQIQTFFSERGFHIKYPVPP